MELCYNKGCGQTFSAYDNTDESCQYHSGEPVFHDAYKSWSCCSKKSINFTDFLNIPGCCKGKHSNIKPLTKEKTEPKKLNKNEPITNKYNEVIDRPSVDEKMTLLEKIKEASYKPIVHQNGNFSTKSGPSPSDICKHNSCNTTYEDACNDKKCCTYHPGVPVFHEGLKYWSCCQKRTTDFGAFLSQQGCETGQHVWEPDNISNNSEECKYDWHQTSQWTYLTFYAKNSDIDATTIKANQIKLEINLIYKGNQATNNTFTFNKNFILYDSIDPSLSKVHFYGTKVEIRLWKNRTKHWKTFEYTHT